MSIARKNVVGMCMALVLTTMSSVPVFAAENPSAPATAEPVVEAPVLADASDEGIQPYGSLSGYNQKSISGTGDSYFNVEVSGSGSPFAGCTLKTSNFSENAEIEIRVLYGDNKEKIGWKSFGPNTEFKNIAMWGVEPGRYKVEYKIKNNNATGTIQCWIY